MSDFSKDGIYKEAKLIALDEPRLVPITNQHCNAYLPTKKRYISIADK